MNIKHIEEKEVFLFEEDFLQCILEYRLNDNVMDIMHVYVPSELGGKGIAASLTLQALTYAKENNLQIVPSCPYVRAYIAKHPEHKELLK